MTLYYLKHFNLYYAGKDKDGTLVFANSRAGLPAKNSREAAEKTLKEFAGEEGWEIEERVL